ncbi:hypothetical protein AVEN_259892-1 [Araneus ventricosus]|uniref:Tc1-like transposase DDE domain-containing protein n=1 Tax=Araneus ventricosus TaxID=182803 RepID=A0A4Y2JB86_ARAVE|nr:hypothetical protein AVEN_259892-1 [Araneus ventricosus]
MMLDGRTDFSDFFRISVTTVIYRDEILRPYVCLLRDLVGPDLIFMNDSTRRHRVHPVYEFLERKGIILMEWPSRSPETL